MDSFSAKRDRKLYLLTVAAIVTMQLVLGICFVVFVPLWLPSDERAHMDNVLDIVRTGKLHQIYPQDSHYESIQPPLYYVCASIAVKTFAPTSDVRSQGYLLRMLGLLLFSASAFLVLQIFSKSKPYLRLGVFACYSFSPIMLAIFCSITNDSLSFLLTILAFLYMSCYATEKYRFRDSLILGIMAGLALLTKLTAIPVIATICLCMLLRLRKEGINKLFKFAMGFTAPIAFLFSPWLFWNISTYHALQPYANAAKSLVHGPAQLRSLQTLYQVFSSFSAYQFLPSEFWYNQFQLPILLKISVILLIALASLRLFLCIFKKDEFNHDLALSTLAYLPSIIFWFIVTLTVSWEPVRGFIGGYFGFVYLCVSGLHLVSQKRGVLIQDAVSCILPVIFLATDAYAITLIMPTLHYSGLAP